MIVLPVQRGHNCSSVVASFFFEKATRKKLRFETPKGLLSVEQLWDLPLTARAPHLSLDSVAVNVYNKLNAAGRSFVNLQESADERDLKLQLEILKTMIKVKQDEEAARKEKAAKAEQKALVGKIIENKKLDHLAGKDLAELEKLHASL